MKSLNRMMQVAAVVARQVRADGWSNVLTGLGIKGKDKRMSMDYAWIRFSESELEHLYATDSTARRIVDYVPDEGTREWIEIKSEKDESVKAAKAEMDRLCVQKKFHDAWSWARLYGGSGILVSVDDGKELDEPLVLEDIRAVKSLTVLNRFELPTGKIITDLENPDFGKQEIYDLSPRSTTDKIGFGMGVHYSRIIRFDGLALPRRLFETNDNWGDSVLPKILNALRNYNSSHDSMASSLSDFRLMILKLKNLADMVGSDDDQALLARLQLLNTSKSVLNSVAIDADSEDITHLDTNFVNLDKVLAKVEERLVADSDLPHTVVLGEGATGTLSGGGESEDDNAKDYVAAQQEIVLTHPINRIMDIIMAAKLGPFRGVKDEELSWEFKPLWQMSEKEKAELHKLQAEADAIYLDRAVLSPETVSQSRFGSGEYSTETQPEDAFNESSKAPKPADPSTEPPKQDDADKIAFDHSHSGFIEGVGYYYTSGANGEGDNHTHTLPNGVETGPMIPLFGGGHMHEIDHKNFTGPGFPLQVATEAQAVMAEAKEPEEKKPAVIELELDLKSGKLLMKGVSMDKLCEVQIDKSLGEKDIQKLSSRFDGLTMSDAAKFKETKIHPTNFKGVRVVLGHD